MGEGMEKAFMYAFVNPFEWEVLLKEYLIEF